MRRKGNFLTNIYGPTGLPELFAYAAELAWGNSLCVL